MFNLLETVIPTKDAHFQRFVHFIYSFCSSY